MRKIIPVFLFFFSFSSLLLAQVSDSPATPPPEFNEKELSARIQKMPVHMIAPRFDRVVNSYIRTYTVRNRSHTENILGRTTTYFPIFEQHLLEMGLPLDLRCLPIVESALNPRAVSRSRAVGLWQFVEPTARDMGLRITRSVDERRDAHKATKAALSYLKRLYNRYGDWTLALAAYNGGPGRVNRAIKRGGGNKNFWEIKEHLPRETRNYIPAFTSALYIWHYYYVHELIPNYPSIDLQLTDVVKVFEAITFEEINLITGVPIEIIRELNPAYKKELIPDSEKGYNLMLPSRAVPIFLNFQNRPDTEEWIVSERISPPSISQSIYKPTNPNLHIKTRYVVQPGDNLFRLSRAFECTVYDVKLWNNLYSDTLQIGQELVFYPPKVPAREAISTFSPIPLDSPGPIPSRQPLDQELPVVVQLLGRSKVHVVQQGEKWKDVAFQYPGLSVKQLKAWNAGQGKRLSAGALLIIMRME